MIAVTRSVEDGAGMIDVLYVAQEKIFGGGTENAPINNVRMVTASTGALLGLLDFSGTYDGRELRQRDVIAVSDSGSVVVSFIAPINSFDVLLPDFQSPRLSLHKL